MRTGLIFLSFVLCSPAAAQRGGRGGVHPRGNGGQFVNRAVPFAPLPSPAATIAAASLNPYWGSIATFPSGASLNFSGFAGVPRFRQGLFGGLGNGFFGGLGNGFAGGLGTGFVGGLPGGFFGGLGGDFFGSAALPYGPTYAPSPAPAAPANVTIVFPPQPAPVGVAHPVPVPVPVPESPDAQVFRPEPSAPPPAPASATQESYPALVAVRNGNLYSVTRYWVTGKTLHFIVTNGDQHDVPLANVEQIYPAMRGDN